MGTPKPPQPPDPAETAAAQTGNNVSTAVANAMLGNFNQTTPTGSLEFNQRTNPDGTPLTYQMTDPNSGEVYDIPLMEAITTLSPEQQQLFNTGQMTQQELANIALDQSRRVGGLLGTEIDASGLDAGGSADDVRAANLRMDYQDSLADVGPIQRGVPGQTMDTNFNGHIADAGDLTRTYGTEWSEDRRRVEDALFSRLNPQLDRDRNSLRTSLVNQGIREGSTAFDRAMNRSDEQSNDARMQTILAGGQEQSRLAGLARDRSTFENQAQGQQFGQNEARRVAGNQATGLSNDARLAQFGVDVGQGEFANQAQSQAFAQELGRGDFRNTSIDRFNNSQVAQQNADMGLEALRTQQRQAQMGELFAMRNQPLNEIGALMSGGQVQMPQFQSYNAPQMPTVDRAGLEMQGYQNEMAAYNARMQQQNSLMGGIFGLAGNVITAMPSDRRLKTDVERVGERGRLGVYAFRYLWDRPGVRRLGYMAQEVLGVKPSAVITMPSGFMAVDYAQLPEV